MPQGNLATHNYEASSPFLATPSGTATGAISTESEHYNHYNSWKNLFKVELAIGNRIW